MAFSDRSAAILCRYIDPDYAMTMINMYIELGLSINIPNTDLISVLSHHGDQSLYSFGAFSNILTTHKSVSFQLWWNDHDDLYVRLSKYNQMYQFYISFDGSTTEQLTMLIEKTRSIYKKLIADNLGLYLIIDQTGTLSETSLIDNLLTGSELQIPHGVIIQSCA